MAAAESIRFVVHEREPWREPRREFDRLEEAQAWHREMAPGWEISKVTTRTGPASGVAQ